MNINTLRNENVAQKTGNLPIALYKNALRNKDGKASHYARVVNRGKVTKEDIAADIVASDVNDGFTADQILKVWSMLDGAIIDRVSNAMLVEGGLGTYYPTITGSFDSEAAPFDAQRHTIDVGFRSNKQLKGAMAALTPVITQGNAVRPEIVEVRDVESGGGTTLTPGGFLDIAGRSIRVAGDDEAVGLYFVNVADDSKTVKLSAEKLGTNTATRVACVVPKELAAGKYNLKIVTQFTKTKAQRKTPLDYVYPVELTVTA